MIVFLSPMTGDAKYSHGIVCKSHSTLILHFKTQWDTEMVICKSIYGRRAIRTNVSSNIRCVLLKVWKTINSYGQLDKTNSNMNVLQTTLLVQ